MKWIKLFESAKYYDDFKLLKDKFEITPIQGDIQDIFQELLDDLEPDFSEKSNEVIFLKYQRTRTYLAQIGIDYYEDRIKKNEKIFADDGNYIKEFLEKSSLAKNIKYITKFKFKLDYRKDSLEEVSNILEKTIQRSNSQGFDIMVTGLSDTRDIYKLSFESDKLNGESLKTFKENTQEAIKNRHFEFWENIYFICDISPEMGKINIDKTTIPTHLQTKFDDFVKKYRIPSDGQKELLNWFKSESNP